MKRIIMHKTNSVTHLKTILSDVLKVAFQHMQGLALELKKLDINESNLKSKSKEKLMAAETMSHVLTIINDVIHPAHSVILQLFDKDMQEFVDYCVKNQAFAVEKKLINPKCNCNSCKSKGLLDGK